MNINDANNEKNGNRLDSSSNKNYVCHACSYKFTIANRIEIIDKTPSKSLSKYFFHSRI